MVTPRHRIPERAIIPLPRRSARKSCQSKMANTDTPSSTSQQVAESIPTSDSNSNEGADLVLNPSKDNWEDWSDDVVNRLDYDHPSYSDYLRGHVACPDPEAEPLQYMEWKRDNEYVVDYLKSRCSEEERTFLATLPNETAQEVWKALQARRSEKRLLRETALIAYDSSRQLEMLVKELVTMNQMLHNLELRQDWFDRTLLKCRDTLTDAVKLAGWKGYVLEGLVL